MSHLDGLAATRQIRKVKWLEAVPVVAVSPYGADQFRDPLPPFEPDALEVMIRSMIHKP